MSIRARSVVGVVLAATLGPLAAGFRQGEIGAAADEPPAMTRAPKGYQTRRDRGLAGPGSTSGFLAGQPELADRTLSCSVSALPDHAAAPAGGRRSLTTIRIWVEENEPHHPCMTYHPDPKWLREHGMNPEKARCVETGQRPDVPRLDLRSAVDGPPRAVARLSPPVPQGRVQQPAGQGRLRCTR